MTSGTKNRTRQAILDAAVALLGQNPAASLGEIAVAAQVGRTTLHRYFAERSDLLAAVGAECHQQLCAATERARVEDGPGGEALLRICREYFDLGPVLSLVFGQPDLMTGAQGWDPSVGVCLTRVVERGHADGSIDPELPAAWVESLLWSQLYAGWSYLGDTAGTSRHDVLRLLTRSLGNALRPA